MADATLYDRDFAAWAIQMAALLRSGRLEELDRESIAEEIEALARRDWRAVTNRMVVVLKHLLKYAYQPDQRSSSWRVTIREQRRKIKQVLGESPSLRARLEAEMLTEEFADARQAAADDTGLSLESFPAANPWTLEQVLDASYLPNDGPHPHTK